MRAAKLSLAVLIAVPFAVAAQDEPPQPPQRPSTQQQSKLEEGQSSTTCIDNIVFSREFLTRYPRAGGACREVKMENGLKWARFDANVAQVRGNQITADFVDRFNNTVGQITFDAAKDARVEVNGRQVRFSTLQRGDKLSFWMPEDRVGFYAAPGASETTKLAVVDTEPARR